jgi:ribosomal protein S18 acetylase RimI-like enzyme
MTVGRRYTGWQPPIDGGTREDQMTDTAANLIIRPLEDGEIDEVIRLWHETKLDAYPYLPLEQGRTVEEDGRFFREVILPRNSVWVAQDGAAVVGFLAIEGGYVDRLYIHPAHQRRGVGTALMARAKELSPSGVQLHTHVKNTQARAFYEKHGFTAVKFGISPAPESEPDVEYHWTPTGG